MPISSLAALTLWAVVIAYFDSCVSINSNSVILIAFIQIFKQVQLKEVK